MQSDHSVSKTIRKQWSDAKTHAYYRGVKSRSRETIAVLNLD